MLKGNYVALITPFKEDGKVNYNKLIELIEFQISNGIDGIVLLGTTGETPSLTENEQLKIIKLGISIINKRVKLIIGVSAPSTDKLIKKVNRISKFKIDYLLVLSPYYLKTNNDGVIKHFEEVANHSKKPIIIYHVPSRTGQEINIECIKILSKHPNIIGIKEASGKLDYIKKLRRYLDENFVLLSGNDDLMVETMRNGGSGVISVLANSHPKTVSKIIELCIDNNYEEAQDLLSKYLDFIKLLFIEPNPIPIKEVMNYLGHEVGEYRLPLTKMSNSNRRILIDELEVISK